MSGARGYTDNPEDTVKNFSLLLVAPPVFDYYATPARMEPLGLLYVLEACRDIPGVTVDLYDAFSTRKNKPFASPAVFSHLDEFYVEDHAPFSLLGRYRRYGDSFATIVRRVARGGYGAVAISSNFSAYHSDVEELARLLRGETTAPVIIGGWAVHAEAEKLSRESNANYLISGNEEVILPRLILSIARGEEPAGAPGLHRPGEPFEGMSVPDDDFFLNRFPRRQGNHYFRGKKISRLIMSRGCANRCSFCPVHGRYPYSSRSLEQVSREIEYLVSTGTEIINFEDDDLFARDTAPGLLGLMNRYREKGIGFAAMNGMTPSNLEKYTEDAIGAGFIEFNLSLVTDNRAASRNVNRPRYYRAIESIALQTAGRIPVTVFLIGGLPGTTPGSLLADIMALASLPVSIGFSPLYLVPGIALSSTLGLPPDRRLMRGSALYDFPEPFTRRDIASIWKYVRMVNHLKEKGAEADSDDLAFFARSLYEKIWYAKNSQGEWRATFSFSIELPRRIQISGHDGTTGAWTFY